MHFPRHISLFAVTTLLTVLMCGCWKSPRQKVIEEAGRAREQIQKELSANPEWKNVTIQMGPSGKGAYLRLDGTVKDSESFHRLLAMARHHAKQVELRDFVEVSPSP